MFFLKHILYFFVICLSLVTSCPFGCKSPADCDKFFTCFAGTVCKADPFGSAARSGLRKDESLLARFGKRCSSHNDCSENQFCNYGLCDHAEDSGTPQARHCSSDNDCGRSQFCRQGQCLNSRAGLTKGRLVGKECLTNMDCEWYELCIGELGICYWAYG